MTNASELLINIVMYDKPKVLTGLDQKGKRSVVPLWCRDTRTQ